VKAIRSVPRKTSGGGIPGLASSRSLKAQTTSWCSAMIAASRSYRAARVIAVEVDPDDPRLPAGDPLQQDGEIRVAQRPIPAQEVFLGSTDQQNPGVRLVAGPRDSQLVIDRQLKGLQPAMAAQQDDRRNIRCVPISALRISLRSRRKIRSRAGARRSMPRRRRSLFSRSAWSAAPWSGAACCSPRSCRCRSAGWVVVAIGDVERRKGRFGILRQPASARLDKARDRPVAIGGTGLAQHRGAPAQLARQHDERAVDVDPRPGDLDGAGDAELRAGVDDAVAD